MSEKRYYWLKLKEDFFDEDVISWLEEQENGKEYCLFYLKLCLKSLKTDGILIRNVGDLLIPYDAKKLSEITRTDIDTVRVAMKVLEEIGLIQILENGEIYLTQLEKMVGSETTKAEMMRKLRAKRKDGNNVTKMLPRDIDIEYRDIEIDKDIEKDNILNITTSSSSSNNIYDILQENGFQISPIMCEVINEWEDNDLTRYAIKKAVLNGKHNINYIDKILYNWKKENIMTVEQAKAQEEDFEKAKGFREKLKNEKKMSFGEKLDMWTKEWEEEEKNEKRTG